MKRPTILIIVLFLTVIGIQSYFLLKQSIELKYYKKIDQLEVIEKPPTIYIMDLTDAADRVSRTFMELNSRYRWLSRHLNNCMVKLEQQKNLEPIPFERGVSGYPDNSPVPPVTRKILTLEEPFFMPHKAPVYKPINEDKKERPIQYIKSILNLNALSFNMQKPLLDAEMQNYEKRLKRLQENF